jgi:uncharacterized membrane protein
VVGRSVPLCSARPGRCHPGRDLRRGDRPLLALIGALVLGAAWLAPLAAWWALRRRTGALERRLAELGARLAALETAAPAAAAVEAEVTGPDGTEPAAPVAAVSAPGRPSGPGLETVLAERWLVWLGSVALALGGLFLAGWAIEQGWLGARARAAAAALLGVALLALAERSRDRRVTSGGAEQRPDAVPAALAAGGLSTLYGATLAAHLVYGLVGPGLGFVLLALVSALGLGLGLRFGPLAALVGTFGAYAAPALVAAPAPAPWPLFLFLGALAPTLAGLARRAGWTWLLWLHLAGAVGWQLAWLVGGPVGEAPGAPTVHLLLAGAGALAALLPWRRWPSPAAAEQRRPLAVLAAVAAGLLLALVLATDHAPAAVAGLVALSCLTVAVLAPLGRELWLAALVAAVDLLAAGSWALLPPRGPVTQLRDPSVGLEPPFWVAPEAGPLATALAVCAAGHGSVGLALARGGAKPPGFWAALSAAVPPLALAYVRLAGLAVSPGFASLALALAAAELAAARWVAGKPGLEPALGAYAVGTVAALALAAAVALERAWLTVALAALLPAMGWVRRRLGLEALRRVAWPIAVLVLARLALDADLSPVAATGAPAGGGRLAWLLHGYGVPAACFWLAGRLFGRRGDDPLVALLQAGAVVAWLLLAAQAIAEAVRPALGPAGGYGLAEAGLNATAWLATAWALLRWWRREPAAIVPRLGALALAGAAALVLVGHDLLVGNPMLRAEPIGAWPIANLLLPGYGLPALLAFAAARELAPMGRALPARLAGAAGHVLALAWLTLEVRRAFQGSVLAGPTGDGEWLAWSAAWLAWAGMLLALGIRRQDRPLRAAALVVASLALAKAFLFDLAELTGLYRAASFLALGLCLIGVGWLHRRFVAATAA